MPERLFKIRRRGILKKPAAVVTETSLSEPISEPILAKSDTNNFSKQRHSSGSAPPSLLSTITLGVDSLNASTQTVLKDTSVRPQAYLDTPQIIYSAWQLARGGIKQPLGELDRTTKICLIGGGMSNLVAALELAKAGADVTLLEATSKVGGRCRSLATADGNDRAEMGSMRFPPSEDLLYYYADQLGFTFIPDFPDPGVFPTIISYQGTAQIWTNNRILAGFEKVQKGWTAFLSEGVSKDGKPFLASSNTLQSYLISTDANYRKEVIPLWQAWLDIFSGKTFYEGLQMIFGRNHIADIPGVEVWTEDDFSRFGSLGLGSGGFIPLFSIAFTTVFRLIPNGLETNQQIFAKVDQNGKCQPTGIQDLAETLLQLGIRAGVKYKPETTGTPTDANSTSVTVDENGVRATYDYVIVGTTTPAMSINMSISSAPFFNSKVCSAIDTIHMTASSKLFIRTKKFWASDPNYPRVILSDTKLPQLYTLDYGDEEYGMVLITYTWEDLSSQIAEFTDPKELFAMLLQQITQIVKDLPTPYNAFADNLVPVTPADYYMIHWQNDPLAKGAFVLGQAGQDPLSASMFYDFLKLKSPIDPGISPILLNGDSIGFSGGWIDGGLQSAMNAVSAIIEARGTVFDEQLAPSKLLDPNTYSYA